MIDIIGSFSGEYKFLSNFYPVDIKYEGEVYPSVEHAYQAAKFPENSPIRIHIRNQVTANKAKTIGRRSRGKASDWDSIKFNIMHQLLREKFKDPHLHDLLVSTGSKRLVEGNYWRDIYWGVCNGIGENNLGRLLRIVREEIQGDWRCFNGHIKTDPGLCHCGMFPLKIGQVYGDIVG